MMLEEKKCTECSGKMVPGQLIDKSYMTSGPQHWSRKATSIMGIGLGHSYSIVSYRCEKCGFLKNYALEEPVDQDTKNDVNEFEDKVESNPMMM